jgi:hypothetical protein
MKLKKIWKNYWKKEEQELDKFIIEKIRENMFK